MKRGLIGVLVLVSALLLTANSVFAQSIRIEKSVIGAGGMVAAKNSAGIQMSGLVGQVVIEKKTGTTPVYNGKKVDVYQGFWTPTASTFVGIDDHDNDNNLSKLTNYPNPFNHETMIKYELPGTCEVSIRIFDINGKIIANPINQIQSAGQYQMLWSAKDNNGIDLASGSYICELIAQPAYTAGASNFESFSLRKIMNVVK